MFCCKINNCLQFEFERHKGAFDLEAQWLIEVGKYNKIVYQILRDKYTTHIPTNSVKFTYSILVYYSEVSKICCWPYIVKHAGKVFCSITFES